MTEEKKDDKERVGLWMKQSKKTGKPYLGGKLEPYWVSIYKTDDGTIRETANDAFIVFYPMEGSGASKYTVSVYNKVNDKGFRYTTGTYNDKRYTIFANTKRQNPNAPDYNLVISKIERQEDKRLDEETPGEFFSHGVAKQEEAQDSAPPSEEEIRKSVEEMF